MTIFARIDKYINNKSTFHAVLFEGEGANWAANYYAKAIVCGKSPCLECSHCKKAENKTHPDIIEVQKTGKANNYQIETIRDLKENSVILPNESAQKVYIFYDIDKITVKVQNALLQILEEPPKHVVFILTCSQKNSILETIISRLFVFSCNEGEPQPDQEATQIAFNIIKQILSPSELTLLKSTYELKDNPSVLNQVLDSLELNFRKIIKAKSGLTNDQMIQDFASSFSMNHLLQLTEVVQKTRFNLLINSNKDLNMTRFCASLKMAAGK